MEKSSGRIPHKRRFGVILVILLILSVGKIHGQDISYTGSLQTAIGDYIFTDQTFSLYFFNGLTVSEGPFRISASLPVIIQSTPWISYSGGGMLPTGGAQHDEVGRRSHREMLELSDLSETHGIGLGDPISRLDVRMLREEGSLPSIHLLTEVKIPVADVNRGFGTGEWDYGGGLSFSKTVQSRFYSLELLYWVLGDLEELELRDPVAFSFAVGQPLAGGEVDILVSLSGYSRIIEGVDHPAQFGVSLLRQPDSGKSFILSADFGLTESAPDFMLSLGWIIGS